MNQNKVITLLIAIALIFGVVIVVQSLKVNNLRGDLEIRAIDLRKKDKQLELKGDSIKSLVAENARLDTLWSDIVKDQLKALEQERAKTNQMIIKYERLKNTPAIRYNEHELDSVISAIIKRRQH